MRKVLLEDFLAKIRLSANLKKLGLARYLSCLWRLKRKISRLNSEIRKELEGQGIYGSNASVAITRAEISARASMRFRRSIDKTIK
jgi:hypothetical protein